jgi:hypothetical protein
MNRYEVECYFPGQKAPELIQVSAPHVQHAREEARAYCDENRLDAPVRMIVHSVECAA